MPILRRKIERLLGDIKAGRTTLAPKVEEELRPELERVRERPDGLVDLESCSSALRSIARAYYGASSYLDQELEAGTRVDAAESDADELAAESQTRKLNETLFAHWGELFRSMTGCTPESFVPEGSSFATEINRLGSRLSENPSVAERMFANANDATNSLAQHYHDSKNRRLHAAAKLPGHKLVLGGAQNFSESSFRAVRSMLLYADSILVPDPVHRWFEKEHVDEGFPRIRMLEDIYRLSQLRPLIEADLPTCPLLVFPSWEKVMEEHDEQTQDGQEKLCLAVLSEALDAQFDDIEEVFVYANKHQTRFLERIEARRLFVAMGSNPGEKLAEAVARQRAELARIRSKQYMQRINHTSDALLVLMGILDRLGPQFHVMDNAAATSASPLFSLPVQWHYFNVCFNAGSHDLETKGKLSSSTLRIIAGLSQKNVSWLGNVPIPDLIRLRSEMANVGFRKNLKSILSEFESAPPEGLDGSLHTVTLALDKLLIEHEQEVKKIDDEYRRQTAQTGTAFIMSAGAAFLPWLPIMGALGAATGAIGKFAVDSVGRWMNRRRLSKTLMGVLAASARSHDS